MNKPPRTVALLISTYNWPQALELVLLSVLKQTRMPDEIVIADDGSGEETKSVIDKFIAKSQITVKHVWHEDLGFRKSLILNKAVKNVVSEYIIEIDGDIIIHKNFIEDHLEAAERGYFVQGSRTMITQERSRKLLESKSVDLHPLSVGLRNRLNSFRIPVIAKILRPKNSFHIKGCNLAFWFEDFVSINGYHNNFVGWGGEDYEFGARLLHLGVKKKVLKFAAVTYHLYHDQHSKGNEKKNEIIYKRTLKENATYAIDGFKQVI